MALKCANGKWKVSEDGDCIFDTEEQCRKAEAAIHAASARCIHIRGAAGGPDLRTAIFREREHLVVPVVAMVEGVVHAVNSATPELVLATELEKSVKSWNGRPVLADHPSRNGILVSANDPNVLESEAFGTTFNSMMKGRKLLMEAWIDPVEVERVGERAIEIMDRIKGGELIEISVGSFIKSEPVGGEWNGERYDGIWREITSDHLALLSEGKTGACSNVDGCGAPRVATVHSIAGDAIVAEGVIKMALEKKKDGEGKNKNGEGPKPTIRERIMSLFKFRSGQSESDMSDIDLRRELERQLNSIEPAFMGVDSVFLEDRLVIYATAADDEFKMFRRGFDVTDDGTVSLNKEKEEVEPVTRFELVSAEGGCGCLGGDKMSKEHKNAERIKALIDNPKTPWTKDETKFLESCDDKKLEAFEVYTLAAKAAGEDVKAKEAEALKAKEVEAEALKAKEVEKEAKAASAAKPKVKTEKEWLADAPPSLQKMVRSAKAAETKRRDELVASLKDAQDAYSEDELKKMEIEDLEKIVRVAQVTVKVDHSGQGLVRTPITSEDRPDDPPSLIDAVRADQEKSA